MIRIPTTIRIAFALAMSSATVLLCLRVFGLFHEDHQDLMEVRARMCESVGVACSQFVSRDDFNGVRTCLESLVDRDTTVLSAGVRNPQGQLVYQTQLHNELWKRRNKREAKNCIYVPIVKDRESWGRVEICFEPLYTSGLLAVFQLPSIQVSLVASLVNFVLFYLFLRRYLRHLDPTSVVPTRVRSALDTLAESIIILDKNKNITLVNQAFLETFETSQRQIQGKSLQTLPWNSANATTPLPFDWTNAAQIPKSSSVVRITIDDKIKSFLCNQSPITDDSGEFQGTLVSLDNITAQEEKQRQLEETLETLEASRAEISKQNEKLNFLATRDPLTGCLNRRAFFAHFGEYWKSQRRYKHPLSCVMLDVDHFKSINDNHGHAMGDEVLRRVAEVMQDAIRETDYICRYGGEEFCILLPHVDVAAAYLAGERFRKIIEALEFEGGLKVTASFGVSDADLGAETEEAMIEQADKCLYVAKRQGRNQVVRFDQIEATIESVQESNASQIVVSLADQAPEDEALMQQCISDLISLSSDAFYQVDPDERSNSAPTRPLRELHFTTGDGT
ncbi:MAG: diguanylate cyclase [Pirellulaceae bacterium]